MKISDNILSYYDDVEDFVKEMNEFLYDYSRSFIIYLSITENSVKKEYDDLYYIKFLSKSILHLESFDKELFNECTKEEWIDIIHSIIYKYSIFKFSDNERICEEVIEHLQMLNVILESFKQLN